MSSFLGGPGQEVKQSRLLEQGMVEIAQDLHCMADIRVSAWGLLLLGGPSQPFAWLVFSPVDTPDVRTGGIEDVEASKHEIMRQPCQCSTNVFAILLYEDSCCNPP